MGAPDRSASLGRRYLFKLISNVATIPLFFIMEAVLPRALGPGGYGNYSFATVLFYQLIAFLDMSSSICFSTRLAQHPSDFSLVAFYSRLAGAMLGICLLCGFCLMVPQLGGLLLPGVPLWLALPSAVWAYLTWAGRVARSANDAVGVTTSSERVRMAVNLGSAVLLLFLFWGGWLTLPVVFLHQYLTLGCLAVGFCATLRHQWPERDWRVPRDRMRDLRMDFWRFSGPLFIMAVVSALAFCGERWMLQFFNGSSEQGFFSLSQKVSMGCFLFITALTPLLMRELAVAHTQGDTRAMAGIIDRYAPMLYAVAAWFACFSSVEAEAVVYLFGGSRFADALLPMQIMALYAVHQGYGQVAGAVFYATGDTKTLRNLTLGGVVLGMACSYFLLAPPGWGGLGLGAAGLALKMVGVQIVTVNILLLACRRVVPFRLGRNMAHQILCPAVLLGFAYVCKAATEAANVGATGSLSRFFLSGAAYTLLTCAAVALCPILVGLTYADLNRFYLRMKRYCL